MLSFCKQQNKCDVAIEGEMTIYNAATLKEQLDAVLAESGEIEINLSQVTEVDSAGVQLLMLAHKECAANQRSLSLVEHSNAVLDVFETLGLVSYFGDPVVVSRNGGE